MTYVDHHLGNADIAQLRGYFPRVRSGVAGFENLVMRTFVTLSSFLAYLASERGPTPSASALVYSGIAAAGAVLYQAWNADSADLGHPSHGLLCERGCLRRMTNEFHLKATEEIRLHQDIFGRRFKYRYVAGRRRAMTSPAFWLTRTPAKPH